MGYILIWLLLWLSSLILGYDYLTFLFAAFEAANFQIDFFRNPVMRTAESLSDATLSLLLIVRYNAIPPPVLSSKLSDWLFRKSGHAHCRVAVWRNPVIVINSQV